MSHKKFGPDRFSRFDVYWIQTNRQTDKPNLYLDLGFKGTFCESDLESLHGGSLEITLLYTEDWRSIVFQAL